MQNTFSTSINFTKKSRYFSKNVFYKKVGVAKKNWKKIFRTHFIFNTLNNFKQLKNYSVKSKRILKNNLKYKLTNLIESSFLDYNDKKITSNQIKFKEPSTIYLSAIHKNIYKELNCIQINKVQQFFILVKALIKNTYMDTKQNCLFENLVRNQSLIQNSKNFFSKEIYTQYLFNQIYSKSVIYGLNTILIAKYNSNLVSLNKYFKELNPLLIQTILSFNLNNNITKNTVISKKTLNNLFTSLNLNLKHWIFNGASTNLLQYSDEIKFIRWNSWRLSSHKSLLRRKRFIAFIKGRHIVNNKILAHYRLKNRILSNNSIKKLVWKNNNHFINNINKKLLTKDFYLFSHKRRYNIKLNRFHKIGVRKLTAKQICLRYNHQLPIAKNLLYFLIRLEEKIDLLAGNPKAIELIKLYNLIQILVFKKYKNQNLSSTILSNKQEISQINKANWKHILLNVRNKAFLKKDKGYTIFTGKLYTLIRKLNKKDVRKESVKRVNKSIFTKNTLGLSIFFNNKKSKKHIQKRKLNIKETFAEKITLKNSYNKITENKNALSLLINKKINLFFINALSLTKYAFNLQRHFNQKQKQSASKYIQKIDRDLINRYKYIAIYIKDLIRICFIGMFLKKPTFITRFIAFQMAKLPRNRKETQFIKFIIKVVKTFAAEREEIGGLRIKFKGRVNRWRRTKSIVGERGSIQLQTMDSHIEYGSAHAINRKGALGIGLWLRFLPGFTYRPTPSIKFTYSYLAKESLLRYIKYSQYKIRSTKKHKYLNIKQQLKRIKIYFRSKNFKQKSLKKNIISKKKVISIKKHTRKFKSSNKSEFSDKQIIKSKNN